MKLMLRYSVPKVVVGSLFTGANIGGMADQVAQSFLDCSNSFVDRFVHSFMSLHHGLQGLPLP